MGFFKSDEKNDEKSDEEKLLKAVAKKKFNKVKSILENNKKINLNIKNEDGDYPLLLACIIYENIKMVKLLIDYANKNNIKLKLNDKAKDGYYPLLWACFDNNTEMVQLLIDYANKNNIKLELNEKDKNGYYPLLRACRNNNIEMVQLLIDYANKNNIKLELNEKNYYGNCPLSEACLKNNIEIIQLLIDYSNKINIELEFPECMKEIPSFLTLVNNYKKGEKERKRRAKEERESERIEKERIEREKNGKEQYINKLKSLMKNFDNNYELSSEKYFEWKINNWNELFYNESNYEFSAFGHVWELSIKLETEDNEEYLRVSLNLAENLDSSSFICTNFVVSLRNINDYNNFTAEIYNEDLNPKFITNKVINNNGIGLGIYPENYSSIIENNQVIIGIYIIGIFIQFYKEK